MWKLRPLMPRPIMSSPISSTPCCCCIHHSNINGVKREMEAPLVSTRWSPTREQLEALEEMYRRGTRTPSAQQIQQIAAKLTRFGKIEGKNVFYWFQNHKARERQKKRRLQNINHPLQIHKNAGLSKRDFEIEHRNKLATPTKCTTLSQDSVSMNGAVMAERNRKHGWTDLQHKKNELSSRKLDLNLLAIGNERETKQYLTLQLFPVDLRNLNATYEEDIIHDVASVPIKLRRNQFIEFLPTKD